MTTDIEGPIEVDDLVTVARGMLGFVGCSGVVTEVVGNTVTAKIDNAKPQGLPAGTYVYVAHASQFSINYIARAYRRSNKGVM